jgi:glycosyltransferase involved in cell wall biosynthesis
LKVAVLIPLYNHERYIGAAFDSLRAQTRPPDRVIVLDDGSTDNSVWAIVQANERAQDSPGHRGSPIQTRTDILFQPNAGAHVTINRLVALADDCDYIAILNSDDRYHPRRIELCLEYLETHPEVDLVCTRLRPIDEHGKGLPPDSPRARWFSAAWSFRHSVDESSGADLAEWLGIANFPGTTSNFFARARYLRENPFADYRFAHDYYALVAAALENRLAILDAELLDYRVHPTNTINTDPERLIREMLRVNVDLARRFGPRLLAEPELRSAFTRYQRATWSNVSGFRADLFCTLLVGALAGLPGEAADALPALFDAEGVPEIAQYPNRALVNTHDPAAVTAGGPTGGLADKFYALKAKLSEAREAVRPWNEYRQLQAALLGSRWFALGRLLGQTREINKAGGKTAPEKLAILRKRIAHSHWLQLGKRWGSASAEQLLAMAGQDAGEENSPH